MIPFACTAHRDDRQELSNWWMPPPQLFCQMIVSSRLTGFQKHLFNSLWFSEVGCLLQQLKGELSTLLSGSCPSTGSCSTALSQYLPQGPDAIWCRCLDVYETDIWWSDAPVHCQLCSLPTSVVFGEQENSAHRSVTTQLHSPRQAAVRFQTRKASKKHSGNDWAEK